MNGAEMAQLNAAIPPGTVAGPRYNARPMAYLDRSPGQASWPAPVSNRRLPR